MVAFISGLLVEILSVEKWRKRKVFGIFAVDIRDFESFIRKSVYKILKNSTINHNYTGLK